MFVNVIVIGFHGFFGLLHSCHSMTNMSMQSVYYIFLRFALRRSCKLCRTSGVMEIDGEPSGMMN